MTLMAGLLPFQHEPYFDYKNPEVAARQRGEGASARQGGDKVEGSIQPHNQRPASVWGAGGGR